MALPSAPFDAAKSIFSGRSVIQLKLAPQLTGVAAEADDDTLTKTAHGLVANQGVVFVSGTGFTGLTAGTTYYVVSPAANTFKLSATVGGSAIDITVDGSVGVFQPVLVFEAAKIEENDNREYKTLPQPDANGIMRPTRKVCVSGAEEWVFSMDEVKRLPAEIFSGAMSGIKKGTATIWNPDPQDDTGKVALKSEEDFACVVTREGNLKHGDGDFSKSQLKIASMKKGDVTFTPDATA